MQAVSGSAAWVRAWERDGARHAEERESEVARAARSVSRAYRGGSAHTGARSSAGASLRRSCGAPGPGAQRVDGFASALWRQWREGALHLSPDGRRRSGPSGG